MTNVAVPLAMKAQMGYWPKNAVPNGSWEPAGSASSEAIKFFAPPTSQAHH